MALDWNKVVDDARKYGDKQVNELKADANVQGFSAPIVRVMAMQIATTKYLVDHCNALEARLAELEKTPFAFKGVHEAGSLYSKNEVVTHDGSMWVALRTTQQRPGDGGDGWVLAVKRGRDAR